MSWFKKKSEEKQVDSKPKEVIKNEDREEHTVREKKIWNLKNIFIAFWIFVAFVVIAIAFVGFVTTNFTYRVILWTVLTIIYAIILFFLLEPQKLREIESKEYKTVEKPVIKEVIKEVDRPVVRVVEKPVYRDVVKEVEKPVYYEVNKPKLDIKRYAFVASKLTNIYHKSSCRLGKSIKKKYKDYSDDEQAFAKKGYKPCKICILKERKV